MLEDFFDGIREVKKKFIDYINLGKNFFASEEELEDLINYYLLKKEKVLHEKAIQLALKLYPNSSIFHIKKGMQYYLSGNFESAIKHFQKAYINDLDNIEAIGFLFISYARKKEFDKAQTFFEKLNLFVKEEPYAVLEQAEEIFLNVFDDENLLEQFINKKFSKIEKFLIEHAYKLYESLDKKAFFGTHDICFERMAFCLAALKKYKEAKECFKKAIEIEPYSENLWIYLSLTELILNNYKDAVKSIEYAVAIDPNLKESNLILANLLIYLEQYSDAISLLEPLSTKWFKEEDKIYSLLAECYESIGDLQVAIFYLEKCLNINPNDKDSLLDIAFIYLKKNDLQKTYYYIEQLKKIDEDNIELHYLYASYYLKKEQYDLGLNYINKALRENPDELEFIFLKSELLEAQGNIIESINYLKAYVDDVEDVSFIFYKLAGLYILNKEISNAYKYLKIAVDKDSLFIPEFIKTYPQAKKYKELKGLLNLS